MEIHDENVFMPCNRTDVYFFDRFADMSNLKFDYLSNGSIHVHGFGVYTRDLGTDIVGEVITIHVNMYKIIICSLFHILRIHFP